MAISRNSGEAERGERTACCALRQSLLVLLVDHVERSTLATEAKVVDRQDTHRQTHFGANRIELCIEGFFGYAAIGDSHRHHTLFAPDEQRERRLERDDLERAARLKRVVGDELTARRIEERFERGELRRDPELH